MIDIVKIKAIIKQYADKGKRLLEEAYENGEHASTTGYWDGYGDCANLLLRELDDMQEEPEFHKPKITLGEATGKLKIDNFTKALAECIHQAQCAVVDPMAHAEIWKNELLELAKGKEPVSDMDFEQELYKYFGQVKDFTLGMRIAKRFYEIGRNHQEPISEDLEEAATSFARKDSEGISNAANFYYTVADKARIFKAGAKWQLNQIRKENEKNRD